MRDAAVERLAKLISEGGEGDSPEKQIQPEFHFSLAEGWFSLCLVAIVVYCTMLCVQAAGWVEHLDRLLLATTLGLVGGVLAAKQQRLPDWLLFLVAACFGILLAFWQTAGAFFDGSTQLFVVAIQHWVAVINSGGTTDDDSIFLFFIVTLSFILAYASAWLVYRARSPWLMIVVNAVVILINLNNAQNDNSVFLIVFLIASLLLLLRFNLYESLARWKRLGLRYAEDLSWDFMQAGALISIGILIFSWILPGTYRDPSVSKVWNSSGSPLVVLENTWNRMFAVNGAALPANHGSFQKSLVLGGNPHLTNEVVMQFTSDDSSQYLGSLSYDTYSGRDWTNQGSIDNSLKAPANFSYSSGALMTHQVKEKVTIINAPQEPYPFIFGASEIEQVNLPTTWLTSSATGSLVAWVGQDARVVAGNTTYTVTSAVSSADIETLHSVPMPKDAPAYPDSSQYGEPDAPLIANAYNPSILAANTALPKGMNPEIVKLARKITAKAPTMYDKVVALETYLRQNYTYSLNVNPPSGSEPVSWFLFSSKTGFCNYFASAMSVMARSIGIPSRVEVGYTNGGYDSKSHQRVVHGVDAHAWTQVYFAGYGWINFEPSATFATFNRPLPNQYGQSTTAAPTNITGNLSKQALQSARDKDPESTFDANGSTSTGSVPLQQELGLAFGTLIILLLFASIVFSMWWRQLFRRYSVPTQIFGRICVLASWAGIKIPSSQTPYEYIRGLVAIAPGEEATLERLSDIYVRDRWADPQSAEHPVKSGEIQELPSLWRKLQPSFFFYVIKHPYFLRWLPQKMVQAFRTQKQRRQQRRQWRAEEV